MSGQYDLEEQENIANLRAWWEDNRFWVIGGVLAAVVAFGGWRGYQHYNTKGAEEAGLAFEPMHQAVKDKDAKKVEEIAKGLMASHPRSFFASDAALHAAKVAFDAGNTAAAREKYEWVMKEGVRELQSVARMRLAAVLLEEKKYTDALAVLEASKDEAFVANAADLRGDIMLVQGRLDEARAAYKLAIDKADSRNPVKQIAETKLNALGGAK